MSIINIVLSVLGILAALYLVAQIVLGSASWKGLLGRVVFTLLVIGGFFLIQRLNLPRIPYLGTVVYVLLYVSVFIVLAMVWWAEIGGLVVSAIMSGPGGSRTEDTAQLSRAEALRKAGRTDEALAAVQEQLALHKDDFDCYMLIASIQAEDLRELPVAVSLLESVLERNKKLERKQVAFALNTLADWHLKFEQDPDAARSRLEQIIERFPETRAAQLARSRIAHLRDKESLRAAAQPKEAKVMPKFERDLGLRGIKPKLTQEIDQNAVTDKLLAQLQEHPDDWDTREKLAIHYIEHYANVPCAIAELETLMKSRLATKEDRCKWLHMIADWQCRIGRDATAARATLQRIIDKYPGTAHATRAEQSMQYLQAG